MNNYEAATDYYCYSYVKYPKKFTWKAFNKFGLVEQQLLSEKYDIILTDYTTKKEMCMKILKNLNIKNVNKGITKFNKGMAQFNKMIAAEPEKQPRPLKPRKRRQRAKAIGDFGIKPIEVPDYWTKDQEKTIKDLLG